MRAVAIAAALIGAATIAQAAGVPPELNTMRKAFAEVIRKHDVKAAAVLTSFPLAFSGYEHPEKVTAAQFAGEFDGLFGSSDAGIVQCLASGKLEADDRKTFPNSPWVIDCNGNEYYFGQRNGKWMFTAYENINE